MPNGSFRVNRLLECIAIAFLEDWSAAGGAMRTFGSAWRRHCVGRCHHVEGRGGRKGAIDGPHHNSQYSFMSGINAWQIKIQEGRRRKEAAVTLINANRLGSLSFRRFFGFSFIVSDGGWSKKVQCLLVVVHDVNRGQLAESQRFAG